MKYQEELKKFFKQRAESFKNEGINLHMDRKIDFTYAKLNCSFESLPKDAVWIEDYDESYYNSRYESISEIGEYDFRGEINLYFMNFKFDFSHIDTDERKKYLRYLYGTEEESGDLSDWAMLFDMDNIYNHSSIPHQFSYGNFKIDGKEFDDYLILEPEFEYIEPWNGKTGDEDFKDFKIYHPTENKFVPVSLYASNEVGQCAALEVVLNDNISIPWMEIDKVKDYISILKL